MDLLKLDVVIGVVDKASSAIDSVTSGAKGKLGSFAVAAGNLMSDALSGAMNAVGASMDAAVARVDTLNQFPKVMQQMGFSAEDAQGSIDRLSAGIDGLPTALDTIASSAQSIALLTGDLDGATDTALALNDAFLASGSSADDASRGLTQYTQMLSKGSVDMQSWRTLQETMGYALRETANAMGYEGESAVNDLYAALSSGEVTFDEFNAKLVELDGAVGGFHETAGTASAGIQTSMDNAKTAVVKNLANIIDAVNGSGAITGFFDGLKGVINQAGKALTPLAESLGGFLADIPSRFSGVIHSFENAGSAIGDAFGGTFDVFAGLVDELVPKVGEFASKIAAFAGSMAGSLAPVVSDVNGMFSDLIPKVADFVLRITDVATGIADGLAPVFEQLMGTVTDLCETVLPPVMDAIASILETLQPLLDVLTGMLMPIIASIIDSVVSLASQAVAAILPAITEVINQVMPLIDLLAMALVPVFNAVKVVVDTVFPIVQAVIENAMNAIQSIITAVMQAISGDWEGAWDTISGFLSDAWENIKSAASEGIGNLLDYFVNLPGDILSAIGNVDDLLFSTGETIINSLWNGLKSIWDGVTGWFSDITSSIPQIKGPYERDRKLLTRNGQAIMQGLAEGLADGWGDVEGQLGGYTASIEASVSPKATGASVPASSAAVISWLSANLPSIIAECTPVMGQRDFGRAARRAAVYA